MREIEALLVTFGPPAILVGAIVEGDVTLLLAGAIAHLGYFHLYTAVALGTLGNMIADSAWYWLARRGSARVGRMTRGRRARAVMKSVRRLADRLGTGEIVACRFVYGTRIVSMAYWGFRRLPYGRFLTADVAGCLIISSLLGTMGFFASHSAAILAGEIRSVERWLAAAAAAAIALAVAARLLARRRFRVTSPSA